MTARPKRSAGRPANPEKAAILARYGSRDNVARWNGVAKSLGSVVPWNDGPVAVKEWMHRHGKTVPPWLVRIIEREETAALESVAAGAPETPAEWRGDHVGFMDSLLSELRNRGERARASGNEAVITLIGKEYAKLAAAREIAAKASRAGDDGLVSLALVLETIDRIHVAIPDRIEGALLGLAAEAAAAISAGEWRQFCDRFRRHTLGDLSAGSFLMSMKGTTEKPK